MTAESRRGRLAGQAVGRILSIHGKLAISLNGGRTAQVAQCWHHVHGSSGQRHAIRGRRTETAEGRGRRSPSAHGGITAAPVVRARPRLHGHDVVGLYLKDAVIRVDWSLREARESLYVKQLVQAIFSRAAALFRCWP